jgi:hypothetical protein
MSRQRRVRSISSQLTRMNLLVSATALLLAFGSFFTYDLISFRQALIRSLTTEAQIIGANTVSALMFDDREAAETTLQALRNSPQVLSATVLRGDGEVFATYSRDPGFPADLPPQLQPGKNAARWTLGSTLRLRSGITFQGQTVGSVYLLADTREVFTRARRYGAISSLALALCLLIALGVTARFRHVLASPLIGLAEAARDVTSGKDYSVRARETGLDAGACIQRDARSD